MTTTNLPIKRTRSTSASSYTWWEELDGGPKELTISTAYTGGAYDGVFIVLLKITKEVYSVVFTTHYILKNFSAIEAKDANKKIDEMVKKIEYQEPVTNKREKYLKSLVIEPALPKIGFPGDWDQVFDTSCQREEVKKSTLLFSKKEQTTSHE
jgi:hypothetical protein